MTEIAHYEPDVMHAIDNADLAESTKYQYRKAVRHYLEAGGHLLDARALAAYARTLNRSSKAFLKAAVSMVTNALREQAKANATPGNIDQVQAALLRLDAIQGAIKVKKHAGSKVHTWLTQAQVRDLMHSCGDDLEGKRDWIVLALLVGAGLRRDEVISLRFEHLKQVPMRNGNGGMRWVLEVQGKGEKSRVVPINPLLAEHIQAWKEVVGDGFIVRSLPSNAQPAIGASLSGVGVFHIVRKHGKMIGRPQLAPHDLRRTYAQLGYTAGVPITQISVLLGHASLKTTQRYLDLDLDVDTTISDFIPLNGD